jgi:hypothetical protein
MLRNRGESVLTRAGSRSGCLVTRGVQGCQYEQWFRLMGLFSTDWGSSTDMA